MLKKIHKTILQRLNNKKNKYLGVFQFKTDNESFGELFNFF